MKKLLTILLLLTCGICSGQILCVKCFDQNDSIGLVTPVNNLIINGGFENNTCGINVITHSFCPSSQNYDCNIANWVCTGGGIATYASFWDNTYQYVVEGASAPYFGNNYCKGCSSVMNDTSCLNNLGCVVTGIPSGYPLNTTDYGGTSGVSLSQVVNGLIPGNRYVLEFWVGGESSPGLFTRKGMFALDIGYGNVFLRNRATSPQTGIGTRFIIIFNATASSQTIKFTNWGHICLNCTELVLDDVRLYGIQYLPETFSHCGAGINEQSENLINVFPNPILNELILKIGSNEQTEFILYDISSRKLLQRTFTNTTTINTEQLAKGMYLYEVRNRNRIIKNGKVFKQ